MAEQRYVCVLCEHEFTAEAAPDRCPQCLSTRGVRPGSAVAKRSAGEAAAPPKRSRMPLVLVLVAAGVIAAAIVWFLTTQKAPETPTGDPGTTETPAAPVPLDPAKVADPAAVTPALEAYAKEVSGQGSDPVAALAKHLARLAAQAKIEKHDDKTPFERDALDAAAILAAVESGTSVKLTSLEAAVFAAALARAAGLEAAFVEDVDAPNSATSLGRKRILAKVGDVVLDPWSPAGRAPAATPPRSALASSMVKAYFLGLQAMGAAERDDFKKATDLVSQALRLAPDQPALLFLKGQVAVLSGMVQFGIEDLERALARKEDALGRYNLGVAYVQAQRFFKAHQALRRAVEIDPKFVPGWLAMASLHLARLQISPEEEHEGLLQSAAEALGQARTLDPDAEGLAAVTAQLMLAQEDERGAINVLDGAIRAHPERAQPYVLLGTLLASKGRWAELVAYLKKGLEHNPDSSEIRRLLLVAYLQTDRSAEAERLLTQALAANPDEPELRVELAGLLQQRGDNDGAARLLEEELQKFPETGTATLLLAQLQVDEGKYADAAKRLDSVLKDDPSNFEAMVLRYIAALKLEDADQARRLEGRIASGNPNGRALLAQILLEQGLFEEGVDLLEDVVGDSPEVGAETFLLVAAYTAAGRDADAAKLRTLLLASEDVPAGLAQQLDMVQAEARRAREEAAQKSAVTPAEPEEEDDAAEDDTPAAPPAGGDIDTGGLAPSSLGVPSIELPKVRMPDAPGEGDSNNGLPKPGIDLPDLGGAP